jgi:hypothetical protein
MAYRPSHQRKKSILRQRSVQKGDLAGSVAGLRQIGHKTGLFIMSYSENLQFKYIKHNQGHLTHLASRPHTAVLTNLQIDG